MADQGPATRTGRGMTRAAIDTNGDTMNGAELIAAERQRQIDAEGWTPEHDDEHDDGELSQAAREYAAVAMKQVQLRWFGDDTVQDVTAGWPWHPDWWKPSDDPIRNLVKAGALLAAEIDRLQRG